MAAGAQYVPVSDWDTLFLAVCDRLTQLVGHAAPIETRTGVLECVAALEQLNDHLAQERARQHEQELQLFKARTSLGNARVELAAIHSNERRSRRLPLHGASTTLHSRSFLGEWLDHALAQIDLLQQPLAVLYLDLNGLEAITNTLDHEVGNELLRIVGSRLAHAIGAENVVSHLGLAELACALTHRPGRGRLSELAHDLFDTVSAPVKIGPYEVAVRPSIGIAMCPADGASPDNLLRNAGAAMHYAKRQGSRFAFFDESRRGAMTERVSLQGGVGL